MHFLFTRTASFLLAFGLFFTLSCSGLKHTESDPSAGADQNANFEQRLQQLNEQIRTNSSNGHYRTEKAELLASRARTLSAPSARLPVYTALFQTAEEARIHTPHVSQRIDALIERQWNREYQEALRLMQQSEEDSSQPSPALTAHLRNAITLEPDNSEGYRLLTSVQYNRGDLSDAIQTTRDALNVITDDDTRILFREKLAYLYLESGFGDEAIAIYREIAVEKPEEIQLRHGLVNALIINGYHEEAVSELKTLLTEHPSRVSYQETLAVENFNYFMQKYEEMLNGSSANIDPDELLALLEVSGEIYRNLQEETPMREELTYNAAQFYKEAAQKLQQLAAMPNLNRNSLNQVIADYRKNALPHWERLAKINPDNTGYAYSLYELYISLDLTEEARQLEETYNF